MTRSEKQAHWQQQIERWQRSGLSQQAWCKQHDIKLGTFSYWRSKSKASGIAPTAPRRFMPLSAPAAPLPGHSSTMGVALADGIRLEIPVVMVEQLLPVILRLARSTD